MDVNCMTLGEINGLIGKEVYAVRDFYVRKRAVYWVHWYEDTLVLGFCKNNPLHSDNCRIQHACLTKESLLKELPKFVAEFKWHFEETYEEDIQRAKRHLEYNLKWLKESEQNFLKQLENM